jgi:tetratricopeptide (TPR) repeat protein
MKPSSRTPEGQPNRCLICDKEFRLEPSTPPGDAPCPYCGSLTWFEPGASELADASRTDVLLHHANAAADQGNFQYAIALLRSLVKRAPQRLDYRKTLRKVEYAMSEHKGGGTVLSSIINAERRRRLLMAKKQGDWEAVETAAEDYLEFDPLDGEVHLELGNAFRQRKMREQAIFAFECAYAILPSRSDIREAIEDLRKP